MRSPSAVSQTPISPRISTRCFATRGAPASSSIQTPAPVLDDLSRDHRLALVTNGAPDVQREKLARATLTHYFATIVISAEIDVGKPDPRIFTHALDAIGATADAAVMIGDSLPRDIRGAHNAGLRSIWIDRGDVVAKPDDAVPDARVAALSQIRSCLDEWEPDAASPRGSP